MQKRYLKYMLIPALLIGGALVFLFAQNGYLFRQPAPAITEKESDKDKQEADDIGKPTNDDPWKEMDKLVAAYYNKQGASFKGTMKLIDDNGDEEKIIEAHEFEYTVLNSDFFYNIDNIEVVQKKGMVLVADHDNKIISMSTLSVPSPKTQQIFDIGEFKKLMEERKTDAKVTQLGNEKILTIENIQDPQVQGYRIYYDPQTFRISKMLIGILRLSPLVEGDADGIEDMTADTEADKSETGNTTAEEDDPEEVIDTYTYYLEIIYTETGILNVTEETFHPENKFIRTNNEKVELREPYKNYQLIINSKEPEEETPNNDEDQ